ncbi:MAG TPA: hypothetical protein VJL29_06010 [Thermoguttaceae bacterium]|nr:hypothetical protein [Thermoguttaceae bacterium]
MGLLLLDRVVGFFTSAEFFLGVLWVGLAALSITLLVLMRTRWGQSQPLRKCFVLSLLAHVLLGGYATTVQIWSTGPWQSGEPTMEISLSDAASGDVPRDDRPWEEFPEPTAVESPLAASALAETVPPAEPSRIESPLLEPTAEEDPIEASDEPRPSEPEPPPMEPIEPNAALARQPEGLEASQAERRDAAPVDVAVERPAERQDTTAVHDAPEHEMATGLPSVLRDSPTSLPRLDEEADASDAGQSVRDATDRPTATPSGEPAPAVADTSASAAAASGSGGQPEGSEKPARVALSGAAAGSRDPHEVPTIYRDRVASDRTQRAVRQGATPESEAAVRAGLRWLAENQEPDGRWDAVRHGAGRELRIGGEDRGGAGIGADTGVTGLSLLAMLAAGHTHQQGDYQDNVRRGLEFLISNQRADGSLSGNATKFAAMYCHAMAAFALSEAYGMTGDARLEGPVRRAIGYTVAAQDPRSGGWRYLPAMTGDTSQLGWQLMALRSAELAGIPTPDSTRRGALKFLASVSSGSHGGLASYRPGEKASRSMTAEGLVCRQLLGMPPESPTATEAADHLVGELPGEGPVNLYYWYYSTLGLYRAQGDHWTRWNEALQRDLVSRQCDSGSLAGSWDPETVWGGYGGRVYTTALATLCLEVYYRYLPRYLETAAKP